LYKKLHCSGQVRAGQSKSVNAYIHSIRRLLFSAQANLLPIVACITIAEAWETDILILVRDKNSAAISGDSKYFSVFVAAICASEADENPFIPARNSRHDKYYFSVSK